MAKKEEWNINSPEYLREWTEEVVRRTGEYECLILVEDKSQLGKYRKVIEKALLDIVVSRYVEPQFRSLEIDDGKIILKFLGAEMPADMPNPMPITGRYQNLKRFEADIANGMAEAMAKEVVAM